MVRIQAYRTRPVSPHRTAENRLVVPTPMIEPVIVWVVETGMPGDVLAVERGNERGVDAPDDLVGDLVAFMLGVEDPAGLAVEIVVVGQKVQQFVGPLLHLPDHLFEEVKERTIA